MILKVEDTLKSLRRNGPDYKAYQDLIGFYSHRLLSLALKLRRHADSNGARRIEKAISP